MNNKHIYLVAVSISFVISFLYLMIENGFGLSSLVRASIIGCVITLLFILFIAFKSMLNKTEKKEEEYSSLFIEGKFKKFNELMSKTNLIDENNKWLIEKGYLVVLAFKLFNNGFLKEKPSRKERTFFKKEFSFFSKKYFNEPLSPSNLSNPTYAIREKIPVKENNRSKYESFYLNKLKNFGDK